MRIVRSTGCFKSLAAAYLGLSYFPQEDKEIEWWPLRGTGIRRVADSGCQIVSIHMPFGESLWRKEGFSHIRRLIRRDLERRSVKSAIHLALTSVILVADFWHRIWKPGWPELDSEILEQDLAILQPEALLFHGDQVWAPPKATKKILVLAKSMGIKIHIEYCSIGPSGESLTIHNTINMCRRNGWRVAPDMHHSPEFEEHLLALEKEGLIGEIQCRGLKEAQRLALAYPGLEEIPLVIEPKDPTT